MYNSFAIFITVISRKKLEIQIFVCNPSVQKGHPNNHVDWFSKIYLKFDTTFSFLFAASSSDFGRNIQEFLGPIQ